MKVAKVKGFTLAELLLVLAILGIITAITLPVLTVKINNDKLRFSWRVTYAIASQSLNLLMNDYDGNVYMKFSNSMDLRNQILKYTTTAETCDAGFALGRDRCWHANDGSSEYYSRLPKTDWLNDPAVIWLNGVMVTFHATPNCTGLYNSCGTMYFDVNGFKSPNVIGRDIYGIYILPDRIKPMGSEGFGDDPNTTCIDGNTGTSNTGWGCSFKYLNS